MATEGTLKNQDYRGLLGILEEVGVDEDILKGQKRVRVGLGVSGRWAGSF